MTGTSEKTDWKAEADALAATQPPFDPCKPDRTFTPSAILDAVCDRNGVYRSDICSPTKTQPLVDARTEYVGAARELTPASFPQIAREMCRKSHSTCCHAHNRWLLRPAEARREVVIAVRNIALGRHGRTQ